MQVLRIWKRTRKYQRRYKYSSNRKQMETLMIGAVPHIQPRRTCTVTPDGYTLAQFKPAHCYLQTDRYA